ncbi:MAG: hypothetical protein WDN44_13780 [Sphingomonas sp.]
MIRSILCAAALAAVSGIADARADAARRRPVASEALEARIAELPAILRGRGGDYDSYFSAEFRAQVPKAKFDAVTAQLTAAGGPVSGIESITPDLARCGDDRDRLREGHRPRRGSRSTPAAPACGHGPCSSPASPGARRRSTRSAAALRALPRRDPASPSPGWATARRSC